MWPSISVNLGLVLPIVSVGLMVAAAVYVFTLRVEEMTERAPSEPEKLDDEIVVLEKRLAELEALKGTVSWQTTAVTWRSRRRLAELKKRRLRFAALARKWELRAKGICKGESLSQRPYAIEVPKLHRRIQS